jgi:hypothetical protein
MEKPFCHLNIPYFVKPSWRNFFSDFKIKQNLNVNVEEILEQDSINFFNANNLDIICGNIWSWPQGPTGIWHIDQRSKELAQRVAINYLLDGDPGITEWIDRTKVVQIGQFTDPGFISYDIRFLKKPDELVDFSESIKPAMPMMIRTDIPHRVDRTNQQHMRWTFRIFLREKNTYTHLTWERALQLLGAYELGSGETGSHTRL